MKIIIKNMNQQKIKKVNIILLIWLSLNFYVKSQTCSPGQLFGIKDSAIKCYNSENACKADGFPYKKGDQCLEYCPSYMYPSGVLEECLDDLRNCIALGLEYYNTEELKCYDELPSNPPSPNPPYYENEHGPNDSPLPDEGGSTYTRGCKSSKFPKLTFRTERCQRECDDGEFFKSNNSNKCLKECDEDDFIKNNECLTECPDFYIEEDNKKKCVSDCKENDKFFFRGDKKCYETCTDSNHNYYNSDNNECLDTCLSNTINKYTNKGDNNFPIECLTLPSGKNFDDDYYLLNSCRDDESLKSRTDSYKCVSYCINYKGSDGNTKIVGVNSNKCELCTKYKYDSSEKKIECLSSCTSTQYIPEFRPANNEFKNECLEKCPQNYFADNSKNCNIIKCREGKGQQGSQCKNCPYYVFNNVNDEKIVVCQDSCESPKNFIKDTEDKECVEICPEYNNVIISSNTCGKFCETGKILKEASTQPSGNEYRIDECISEASCNFLVKDNTFDHDKDYCFEECPSRFQFMVNRNKKCLQECPTENKYYYTNEKGTDSFYTCKNINQCKTNSQIYCDGSCYNEDVCLSKGIYFIDDYNCVDKCSSFYKTESTGVIKCIGSCGANDFTIGNQKECLEKCPQELNFYFDSDKKCLNECPNYYEFKENVNGIYSIYECVGQCQDLTRTRDKACYHNSCPSDTYKLGSICYDNCFLSPNEYSLSTEAEKTCLTSCKGRNMYYYETDKECLSKCNTGDYAVENTNECIRDCGSLTGQYYFYEDTTLTGQQKFCVQSCRDPLPYLYDNTCVKSCGFVNSEKRYILEAGPNNKKCLTDCVLPYIYYVEKKNTFDEEKYYECSSSYNFYAPNSNPNKIGKLKLASCNYNDDHTYKYKIGDKCYEKCPEETPFYILNNQDNQCYSNCPSSHSFHEKEKDLNYFICKESPNDCINDYADFDEKLCLRKDEKCPASKKVAKSGEKFVCLNQCNSEYGPYLTEYDTCVNSCEESDLVQGLNYKAEGQNCNCINLFYKEENEKTCFPDSINSCKSSNTIYKISFGNECISVCDNDRILSHNGEVCHDSSYQCNDDDDLNTEVIVRTDGIKQCECKNQFYLDNTNNIKKCFDGVCGNGYKEKYVPEIKRCMKNGESCPADFNHVFLDKVCLRQCPTGATETNSGSEVKCECIGDKPFWRKITENSYECLIRCPLFAIASTSECVDSCTNDFPIFYDFKCFANCGNSDNLNIKDAVPVSLKNNIFAQQTCDCASGKKWYITGNIKNCVDSCSSFKYEVYSTKECVNECPIDNYYIFNEYCYKRCEDNPRLQTKEPYRECLCKYGWYYTNSEKTMRQCLNSDETCLSLGIGKNYLMDSTKECVDKCPEYLYEFNYVCYDECPQNTIDHISDDGNYCTCNLNDGYWYEYLENGFTYKSCGWEKCPEYEKNDGTKAIMNLIESEKKCVKSCKTDGGEDYKNYYAFKNKCIKDCPILTKTNSDDDECSFYDLTNDNFINDRDKFKDAAKVQTNELYAKDETIYNKFDFSLEIYSIDDTSKRNEALKSKKTYIDFSSCLKRIYLDKNITDPEKILIAKYDLLPEANINIDKNNDKYLINPVEYELFSSSDTNERLDSLVCKPNEIMVSYPLCLNKFDKKEGDAEENEFRVKFDLGKKLHDEDSSIDTFNFNNTIYKDFCRGLEIDGKDLVFEDRYKYLYPYNKILCESNCTLKNTDFELERVNCLCAYKGEFDFYRKEDETNDIFNDKKYFIPSQSGANAEAIKCLFNFSFSQATIKNEAFYWCFVITAVEVVLLFINIIYGIKGVSDNIKKSLNKLNDIFRKNKNNKNKNQNILTTSNKPLNNPPRKNNNEEEKDAYIDSDKITSESFENKSGYSEVGAFKSEYIPSEYCFKLFKENERGVLKKIDKSKIPFGISPDTKYLIEKRNGGDNENNYLVLTDANTNNNDINKMIKFIKDEKLNKNKNENKFESKTKKRVNLFEDSKNNENYKKFNEKNLITVKKINPIKAQEYTEDWTIEDFEKENEVEVDSGNACCITLIRREQLFLRINYEKYIAKKHPSNAYIFFAEVLDKIYLVKIILFLGKYDIFFIQLSLYIFCYLLLLSLICGFFTIKVIKKIWELDNYPDFNFYLLYGLISHIILWIIYKIFLNLLDCNDKIKELLLIKKALKEEDFVEEFNDNSDEKNQNIISKKYKEQASHMKLRIFIFYVIMFAIIIFCTIYLISFFSIYTGTKTKVFIAYFVSLFEIVIIKVIYGLCLASLRLASKVNKMKSLYDLVYVFDKFIS